MNSRYSSHADHFKAVTEYLSGNPSVSRSRGRDPLDQPIDPDQAVLGLHEASPGPVPQSPGGIVRAVPRTSETNRVLAVERRDIAVLPDVQHCGPVALEQCKLSHDRRSTHGAS